MKHSKNPKLFKPINIYLLLILCIFFTTMGSGKMESQAAVKPSLSSMIKEYKAGHFKKGAKIAKKLPQKANEKCVKKMSSKMKKAYRKKVKSFNTNIYSSKPYIWDYYLTDINKDGKAELLIEYGTCEADVRMLIYKYSGGNVKKIGQFYCSHFSFYHYSNGILVYWAFMGSESIEQIYFKNGKLKTRTIAEHDAQTSEYLITLPYALKNHEKFSTDYSHRWMDLKDLQ